MNLNAKRKLAWVAPEVDGSYVVRVALTVNGSFEHLYQEDMRFDTFEQALHDAERINCFCYENLDCHC